MTTATENNLFGVLTYHPYVTVTLAKAIAKDDRLKGVVIREGSEVLGGCRILRMVVNENQRSILETELANHKELRGSYKIIGY